MGGGLWCEHEQSQQPQQPRWDHWCACREPGRASDCLPAQQAQPGRRQRPRPRLGRRGSCFVQHPWSAPAQQQEAGKGWSNISPVAPQTSVFTATWLNQHMTSDSPNRLETAAPLFLNYLIVPKGTRSPRRAACDPRSLPYTGTPNDPNVFFGADKSAVACPADSPINITNSVDFLSGIAP